MHINKKVDKQKAKHHELKEKLIQMDHSQLQQFVDGADEELLKKIITLLILKII